MDWKRSEALALAMHCCKACRGSGIHLNTKGHIRPCQCVLRGIFRVCLRRFQRCSQNEKFVSCISLEYSRGPAGRVSWGRKDEEYMADFYLVSKRTLTEAEFTIFKYYHLLGADWRLCCHRLKLNRGSFFHDLYRIEAKLGRVFRELQPYALFPLDEYFRGTTRGPVPTSLRGSKPVPVQDWELDDDDKDDDDPEEGLKEGWLVEFVEMRKAA